MIKGAINDLGMPCYISSRAPWTWQCYKHHSCTTNCWVMKAGTAGWNVRGTEGFWGAQGVF